jgi:hypothetical protein
MTRSLIISLLSWVFLVGSATGQTLNGFELADASIPARQIRGGGPPRDGIPSIDKPNFQSAESVDWLRPDVDFPHYHRQIRAILGLPTLS